MQFLAAYNRSSQQEQRCPFFGIRTKINGIWLQDVIFQNTGLKIGLNASFNNTNLHYCRVYKRTSLPEYTDAVSIPEFTRIKYATRAIEIATTLLIKTIFILISPRVKHSASTSRSQTRYYGVLVADCKKTTKSRRSRSLFMR